MAPLLALPCLACATSSVQREEVDGLRTEVAELRAQQMRQDRELAALRNQLRDHPDAMPVAASTTARAEATTITAASEPRIPEDLKVVYVAPDPIVLSDAPARGRAAAAHPRGPPTPLPVDTELREPVAANPAETLSPEAIDVAYKAALAAPDASNTLERFAQDHAEAPQADNALFEAGVHAEREGNAERAAHDFDRVVREHPAGDVVADALLHLAGCQLQLHQNEAAKATLTRISNQFPGSAQAEAAQTRLGDLGG